MNEVVTVLSETAKSFARKHLMTTRRPGRQNGFGQNKSALDGCDVLRPRPAAAADRVDQSFVTEWPDLLRHLRPLLVVPPHGIGQPRVGVAEHPAVRARAQVGHILLHVGRTQRAVETHGKGLAVGHAVPERLVGLPAQRAACRQAFWVRGWCGVEAQLDCTQQDYVGLDSVCYSMRGGMNTEDN